MVRYRRTMEAQLIEVPKPPRRHTFADVVALGDAVHAELIEDEVVIQAAPDIAHGGAAGQVAYEVIGPFQRGRGGPGGWWILAEVDVLLGDDVVRPDLLGFK